MADPDIVTLREGIETVQGLVSWLKHAGDGCALQYTESGTSIVAVADARRAGRTLELLLHTVGMA